MLIDGGWLRWEKVERNVEVEVGVVMEGGKWGEEFRS
jgi:hypothetical protein